jgi:hypothetical protein
VLGVILFLAGVAATWIVAHIYYRRSTVEPPTWAKPLIERFGDQPPSREQLIEWFNEAVEGGDLIPHVPSGYVACPKCKAPSSELEYYEVDDPKSDHRYAGTRCKKCGWDTFLGDVW